MMRTPLGAVMAIPNVLRTGLIKLAKWERRTATLAGSKGIKIEHLTPLQRNIARIDLLI